MHDIGKALTHELDGSHAVIGADYARRLGEAEVVANAIGAHHTDEPFNSAYAYLVAAADAMSGARPGARRQTDENYVAALEDLERITRGFRGVAEAFAVQGGREVRDLRRGGPRRRSGRRESVDRDRAERSRARCGFRGRSGLPSSASSRPSRSPASHERRHPPSLLLRRRAAADDRRRGAGGDARPSRRRARDQRGHARAARRPRRRHRTFGFVWVAMGLFLIASTAGVLRTPPLTIARVAPTAPSTVARDRATVPRPPCRRRYRPFVRRLVERARAAPEQHRRQRDDRRREAGDLAQDRHQPEPLQRLVARRQQRAVADDGGPRAERDRGARRDDRARDVALLAVAGDAR